MRYLLTLLIFLAGCEAPADDAPLPIAAPVVAIEPAWTHYGPVRNVRDEGPVLTDIDSHLPQGNGYTNEADPVRPATRVRTG